MPPPRHGIPVLAVALAAGLITALAAGPAAAQTTIEVVHPWVRPTIPNRPAAVYLGIHNLGDAADRLVGARATRAEKAELHKSEEKDGMMTMTPVEAVEIPAGGMAHLGPGGLHLMLFGIDPPLKDGETLGVTLEFERAGEIEVQVPVAREAPAGVQDDGHGHDHGGGQGHGTGN